MASLSRPRLDAQQPSLTRPLPMRHRVLLPLIVSLLLPATVAAQPATDIDLAALAAAIEDTIRAETYAGASWGIHVVNLRSGETLYSHRADDLFVPASNVKLLTSAAALEQLGPDFRYRSRVYVDGPVQNGTLHGNLIVRGSGDPTLGHVDEDRAGNTQDPTRVFRAWADSLAARGITHITGDIVGDDTIFKDTPLGHGWSWDDAPYGYSAEIGGLVFNGNTIQLRLQGQQPGMPGRMEWTPIDTDYVTVVNQSRTVRGLRSVDESYERVRGSNTIHVGTRLPPGAVEEEELSITNPTLFTTHVLREVLLQEGISVQGGPVDLDAVPFRPAYASDSVRVVATHTSPPLRDIIATLNRDSNNLYAEQLLRTLSVATPPDTTDPDDLEPGSSALGARRVGATLAHAGVDTSHVQIADGSGLSRYNLVSPSMLTRLLDHMWSHPDRTVRSAFHDSLPVGGRDGTLEYRFRGSAPANGDVRAKTGTLSSVSALTGYIPSARGTPLAFSILCNHHVTESSHVRAAQDVIVNALARMAQ